MVDAAICEASLEASTRVDAIASDREMMGWERRWGESAERIAEKKRTFF